MNRDTGTHIRTVVVTGASAGVGRATVLRFARDGARLGLISRDSGRLSTLAAEVRQLGGEAVVCPADVADPDAVERAAGEIERAYGAPDVWVNAAMATVFGPFMQTTADEFRRATEVTYLGFVHGTRAALKRMQPRDRGVIVQVGSALAYRSIPLQAAYCGAKHAMVGFTDALRCELIHQGSGVELVVVHLPGMNTPQFDWGRNKMAERPQPLPPIFQPEIAAEAIHFAALHPRRELWLGWPTVKAMLGQKLLPRLLDRMLARQAYSGQQADAAALDRPDNLFATVEGDFGAHGRFDDRARDTSPQLALIKRLGVLAPGALIDALIGPRRRRRER